MTRPMTDKHFAELLDRLGPDLETWPPVLAIEARGLLASSSAARLLLDEAQRLDRLVRRPAPDVADLKARILAAARATGQSIRDNVVPFRPRRFLAPAAFALAASLLVGVFAGWSGLVGDPLTTYAGDDAASLELQALTAGDSYDS